MRRHLQLAAALLLTTGAPAQFHAFKPKSIRPRIDAEWMWQYSPPPADGRENDLIQDPNFLPFLQENLTAPQTFWGGPPTSSQSGYKPLATTAYDFLAIPGKVIADDNRYITITGCVFHFCANHGLLWVDLNAKQPLVAFAATDWVKSGKPASDPTAEYTLWLFTNKPFGLTPEAPNHLPAALTRSLARWAAEPTPGARLPEFISHAVLIDPDGTAHPFDPAVLGFKPTPATTPNPQPASLDPKK